MANFNYIDEREAPHPRVTREEVDACAEPEQLRAWIVELQHSEDEIRAQLTASRCGDAPEPGWRKRASVSLSYALIGQRRCERRLVALGEDGDRTRHTIAMQQQIIDKLRAERSRWTVDRAFVAVAHERLEISLFGELAAEALVQAAPHAPALAEAA